MIVILIGLIAFASSSLRGAAGDVNAQRSARRALLAQKSLYADAGEYGDAAAVKQAEPSLPTTDRPPQVMGEVFVRSDGATTTLASADDDGNCYWIRDDGITTRYAKAPCGQEPPVTEFKRSW
ncbi:MAG: hypothetical protein ACLGHT_01020 [Acidimicrobiia bacterium]